MTPPADPFDPRHFAEVRRPVTEASNLPPWSYTSEPFFQRELERVFRREWLFVAREERIASPGDYLATEIATVPVLLVRGRDGVARAFANSCRHRGCLIASGEGNAERFTCPYHAWAYGADGTLLAAPTEMEHSTGFTLEAHGLRPIRLEGWGGFLFLNFSAEAPPLARHLGNLPDLLARYRCEEMRLGRRLDFDVGCNWKFYVENLKDAQHVQTVHRRSISVYASPRKYWREVQDTTGNVISTFMNYPGSAALLAGDSGFPPIPGLTEELAGTCAPLIFPNLYISCTTDCAWYLYVDPVAVDRCRVEQGALFPRSVFERADCAEVMPRYLRRFDMTQEEDNEICEMQQRGVRSPLSMQGRYAAKEALVHRTVNWLLDRVLDPA